MASPNVTQPLKSHTEIKKQQQCISSKSTALNVRYLVVRARDQQKPAIFGLQNNNTISID